MGVGETFRENCRRLKTAEFRVLERGAIPPKHQIAGIPVLPLTRKGCVRNTYITLVSTYTPITKDAALGTRLGPAREAH